MCVGRGAPGRTGRPLGEVGRSDSVPAAGGSGGRARRTRLPPAPRARRAGGFVLAERQGAAGGPLPVGPASTRRVQQGTKVRRRRRRSFSRFGSTTTTRCQVPSAGRPPSTGIDSEGATTTGR